MTYFSSRSLFVAFVGLVLSVPTAGCAASRDDVAESAAGLSSVVHQPQGDERKAIFAGLREQLTIDLHGQTVIFNSTDPVGRFLAHGEWAYFEGILEGPDGNTQPIDYRN